MVRVWGLRLVGFFGSWGFGVSGFWMFGLLGGGFGFVEKVFRIAWALSF